MTTHAHAVRVAVLSMFLLTFLSFSNLFSQNPTPSVIWQKTIGGSNWDEITETQPTTDGGSISVGYSHSPASGDKSSNNFSASPDTCDVWIVKLDASGNIQWEKTILANSYDGAQTVKQTADGGYLVGGSSNSGIAGDKTEGSYGEFDYWILKLDVTGTIQWQKTLGGSATDVLQDLQLTQDGGFIVAGYSESGISGNKTVASLGANDMWVIKFDANGVEQWQKSHGTNGHDIVNELKTTADGGYILGGHVYGYSNNIPGLSYYGAYDYIVVKIDANGNEQWKKNYGGSGDDYIESLQQTADGGYILGGYSTSNISGIKTENNMGNNYGDYWIIKIDAQGTLQWQNTIGGNSIDWLESIQQTADGGYIMHGYSYSPVSADKTETAFGDADIWIVKVNNVGSVQWQKVLGGSSFDIPASLQQVDEGNGNYSYLVGAHSASDISGNKSDNSKGSADFWVVKLGDLSINTPSVTDVYYCPNDIAQPLTAVGQNLLWYTTLVGGVGSANPPTPSTTTPGITTYYVSQTINNVESPRALLNVIVKTPPSVTITGLGTMCAGTSQTITAYAGTAFVWNDGVTTGTRTIAPTTTTTYTVTLTGQNGCINTGSRTFIVNQPPTASVTGNNTICAGTSTTLTASGGGTYRWSTGQTTTSITVTPSVTTTYTVTVTLNGCTSTATRTVTVNGIAPSSMSIVGLNSSYPKNAAPVTLVGTPSGGTFRVNNQIRTTFNPQNLSLGNHTVNYRITQSGCTTNIYRTVSVVNGTTTSNLQANNQSAFNGRVELNRVKLEWANNVGSLNDYFIIQKMNEAGDFIDFKTIDAAKNTNEINAFSAFDEQPTEGPNTYRIKTVFIDGTSTLSLSKTLNYSKLGNVQVFPNPASENLDVNLENYIGQPVELTIYNQFGQSVLNKKIEEVGNQVQNVELINLQNGQYILRVASPEKRDAVVKFIINK